MYAKLMLDIDTVPTPVLVVTTAVTTTDLVATLRAQGWGSHDTAAPRGGSVTITEKVIRLTIEDTPLFQVPVHGAWAPIGWWEATGRLDNRCVLIVANENAVDLQARELNAQLHALVDSAHTVSALVSIAQ